MTYSPTSKESQLQIAKVDGHKIDNTSRSLQLQLPTGGLIAGRAEVGKLGRRTLSLKERLLQAGTA